MGIRQVCLPELEKVQVDAEILRNSTIHSLGCVEFELPPVRQLDIYSSEENHAATLKIEDYQDRLIQQFPRQANEILLTSNSAEEKLSQVTSLYHFYQQALWAPHEQILHGLTSFYPADALRFTEAEGNYSNHDWLSGGGVQDPFGKPYDPGMCGEDEICSVGHFASNQSIQAKVDYYFQSLLNIAGEDHVFTYEDYQRDLLSEHSVLKQIFVQDFGLSDIPSYHKVVNVMPLLQKLASNTYPSNVLRLYLRAYLDPRMDEAHLEKLLPVFSWEPQASYFFTDSDLKERDPHLQNPFHHQVLYAAPSADGKFIELFMFMADADDAEITSLGHRYFPCYVRLPLDGDLNHFSIAAPSDFNAYRSHILAALMNHGSGELRLVATNLWQEWTKYARAIELELMGNPTNFKSKIHMIREDGFGRVLKSIPDHLALALPNLAPLPTLEIQGALEDKYRLRIFITPKNRAFPGRERLRVRMGIYEDEPYFVTNPNGNRIPFQTTKVYESQSYAYSISRVIHRVLTPVLERSPLLKFALKKSRINILVAKNKDECDAFEHQVNLFTSGIESDCNPSTTYYRGEFYIIIPEAALYGDDAHVIFIHELGHTLDEVIKEPDQEIITPWVDKIFFEHTYWATNAVASDEGHVVAGLHRFLVANPKQAPSVYALVHSNELWPEMITAYIRSKVPTFVDPYEGFRTSKDSLLNSKAGRRIYVTLAFFEHLIEHYSLPALNSQNEISEELRQVATRWPYQAFKSDIYLRIDQWLSEHNEEIDHDQLGDFFETLANDKYLPEYANAWPAR
ncbi:MAG: hypothetical protein HYU97_00620 [Deltaproteobacteria bacterium]|nr:hypothetical protein [Deltaproteobacteria bacterium]